MEIAFNLIIKLFMALWLLFFYLATAASQPLILCLLLIIYSMSLAALTETLVSNWLCYAILLIFLGGIIVVFLYVRTLSSETKLFLPQFPPQVILRAFLVLLVPSIFCMSTTKPRFMYFLSYFFLKNNFILMTFLVGYLLLALFLVVKFSESFKGALIKSWH